MATGIEAMIAYSRKRCGDHMGDGPLGFRGSGRTIGPVWSPGVVTERPMFGLSPGQFQSLGGLGDQVRMLARNVVLLANVGPEVI